MRFIDVDFRTICSAICSRWKRVVCFTLAFAILGVCSGAVAARKGDIVGTGSADSIDQIDFFEFEYDKDYYLKCADLLLSSYKDSLGYVTQLKKDKLISDEQKETLEELEMELNGFAKKYLAPIEKLTFDNVVACCPKEFIEDEIKECEELLEKTEAEFTVAKIANEQIKEIDSKLLKDKETIAAYQKMVVSAEKYAELMQTVERYEKRLDLLKNEPERIEKNVQLLEKALKSGKEQLNLIIETLDYIVGRIAEENHLNIKIITYSQSYLKKMANDESETVTEKEVFEIGVGHTFGVSLARDAFIVLIVFCTLVGICTGAYSAICREGAKENKGCDTL